MDIKRLGRHLWTTEYALARMFPAEARAAIEQAIAASEARHDAEIRFAVEASLEVPQVIAGQTARARALDVFAQLRVWDTENNNGVLLYVLLADRAVEIVADRGIDRRVGAQTWRGVCAQIESAMRAPDPPAALIDGILALTLELARHFPPRAPNPDELPNLAVAL